jgi:hypothetical protein
VSQFDSIRFQPSRPLLKEVSADRLNAILSEIKKNRPRGERGITVRQSGDATYIGLAANTKAASAFPPFNITVVDQPTSSTYKVKVTPGLIAQILPSNYNDEFSINSTALHYGVLQVSTDGQYITGAQILFKTTPPTSQPAVKFGLAAQIEILFGLFKEGVAQNLTGGRNIDVAGRNVLATQGTSFTNLGAPLFDLWFRLQ